MKVHGIEQQFLQLAVVYSITERSAQIGWEKEGQPAVFRSWYRTCNSRKKTLLILSKNGEWNRLYFIGFWTYWLGRHTRSCISFVQNKNRVPSSRCEMPNVLKPVPSQSISSIVLRIFGRKKRALRPGYSTDVSEGYRWKRSRTESCPRQNSPFELRGRTHHALFLMRH